MDGVPLIKSSSSLGFKMRTTSCGTISLKPRENAAIWSLMESVIRCAATRLTYSSLFSSVTETFAPSGIKSTAVSTPK